MSETITWYNAGKDIHSLIFDTEIPPYGIKIGDVVPVGTLSKRFDFYVPRIDYSCATHPEEKGTIIIYEKNEDEMTDTERLRHLLGFLGTKPPDVLSHLRHAPIVYGKTVLPDIAKYVRIELSAGIFNPVIISKLTPDSPNLIMRLLSVMLWLLTFLPLFSTRYVCKDRENQNTEYTSIIPKNSTIGKYFKKLSAKWNMTPYEENQLQ